MIDEAAELKALNLFAQTLDPSAKVFIKDDSPLMRFFAVFVRIFNASFMTRFATTICNRVYILRVQLGSDLRPLLVHEVGGHVRQCRRCGLGIHPWVGFLLYTILYALVLFPIKGAFFRYYFERGADAVRWAWCLRNGTAPQEVRARAQSFATTVASWDYLKPWPEQWVLNGFRTKVEQIITAYEAGSA